MPVNLPVLGPDLRQWGRQLNIYLQRNLGKLYFRTSDDNPSENGILLWDDTKNYPGSYQKLVLTPEPDPAGNSGMRRVFG